MSFTPRSLDYASSVRDWTSRRFRGLTWSMFGAFWLIIIANGLTQLLHLVDGATDFQWQISFTTQRTLSHGVVWLPSLLCVIVALNVESKTATGRVLALATAILLGAIAQQIIEPPVRNLIHGREVGLPPGAFWVGKLLEDIAWGSVAAALLYFARRDSEAMERLHREELDRINVDRQMTEARLGVLQAQIEPHFLFNTLANVQRLYEIDPPSGKSMLQHLRAYLAAALPEMRASRSTFGRELALTVAYLNVQKIRMGKRLTFDIDVPERLTTTSFPSMMLLTLVENAIRHGLGPLPEGGSIRIAAREHAGDMQLQVRDDGAGLALGSGAGLGLANSRMRLATLYGSGARLRLEQNAMRGVTATIELPIEKPAAAGVTR